MKSVFRIISVCAFQSRTISHLRTNAILGMSRQMKRDIFS
ncbi:hypothetical protein VR7878_00534 [Vibrio ruber DSM 16370]|uniref:Uncharacterized protein n=1 Tax=Vibrio ruber (strain DSM 16370 / JCM 11486 / BCRC 17186 / CECT 7878 / LMG 23124 / VR1) TaxID=1123498 RepID=A0A1R4LBI1_VIBR1|nr:hypothetical protein VR7878_00534 [Vibrio ruber DSM 16370]